MSFLSSLREQHSVASTPDTIKLVYLLRPDHQNNIVLALFTRKLDSNEWTPYVPQHMHLVAPPAFLHPLDCEVLARLTSSDSRLKQDWGAVPTDIMEKIIASGRAFVRNKSGDIVNIQRCPNMAEAPYWQSDLAGQRFLRFESMPDGQCWRSAEQLWLVDAEIGKIKSLPYSIQPIDVETVFATGVAPVMDENSVATLSDRCVEVGLPPLDSQPTAWPSASLEVVLSCFSTSNAKAILQLGFRYTSEQLCFYLRAQKQPPPHVIWTSDQLCLFDRYHDIESNYRQMLTKYLAEWTEQSLGQWRAPGEHAWRTLLLQHRQKIERLGVTFDIHPDFKYHYVKSDKWQVETVRSGDQQFQLSLKIIAQQQSFDLFPWLKEWLAKNEDVGEDIECRLPDGKIVILESNLVSELCDRFGDWFHHGSRPGVQSLMQAYRLVDLKLILPPETHWDTCDVLREETLNLSHIPMLQDKRLPDICLKLRPYQWLGVCWLQHLKASGYNGLLADDMGLGKTLQALAHLSIEYQKGRLKTPALIVAPTSLLHNWRNEIEQFCPQLSSLIWQGPKRFSYQQSIGQHAIVITSYHSLMNDAELWQTQSLSWLILDEAQTIKNRNTQIRNAVIALNCRQRVCLSGTPVENHLGELWSIMDFLMPGVLGSSRSFEQYYQKPIEKQGDSGRMQQLLHRIKPLVLRRTKQQVAKDLPDKTVALRKLPLSQLQQDLYDSARRELAASMTEKLDAANNDGEKQLLVLSALLKLRQICCDPALTGNDNVPSSKREHCLTMIKELVAEGRSVLVFSQFTQMLDLLSADLNQMNIAHLMLTGKTQSRGALVERFQAGEVPVFLISLKAGGVGLNLTRADTVIMYDPWWNQAAEQQAWDRAHRIGQKNAVFVYKLIAENTIEEKIASLQTKKAVLSDYVNQQAQVSGQTFSRNLKSLMQLWQETIEL